MDVMTFTDCTLLILKGLLYTALITLLSLPLGTLLGAAVYAMTLSRRRWVREVARWYRYIVRGTPLIVLLLAVYYVVLGGGGGLLAAVIAFSLNFSNFACADIGSSIDSVGRDQIDAGRALGLSNWQNLRYVVAPQAVRYALPTYKFQAVGMVKSTSVVGYVAMQDLTQATMAIRQGTGQMLIPLLVATAIYFILAWLLSKMLDTIVKHSLKNDNR